MNQAGREPPLFCIYNFDSLRYPYDSISINELMPTTLTHESMESPKKPETPDIDILLGQFNTEVAEHIQDLLEANDEPEDRPALHQDELVALAAQQSMPKDALARMLLLEEFKKNPDGRFSDNALTSLEALQNHGKNVRMKMKSDWRNCLSYPDHVSSAIEKKLDEISLLIDMPDVEDRYSRLGRFLEAAETAGLISRGEHRDIRTKIGPEV